MNNPIKVRGLFLIQLPGPFHGVSVFNEMLAKSKVIKSVIDMDVIDINTSRNFTDIQKFNIPKIYITFKTMLVLVGKLLHKRFDFFYISLSPTGIAFYRDLIYIGIAKLFCIRRIYHMHGQGVKNNSNSAFNRMLYRWCFKKAITIVLSKGLFQDLANFVDKKLCSIFPNAIHLRISDESLNVINKNRLRHKRIKFLFLSNILISKGALVLLDAINILKTKYNFRVTYVGQWFRDGCKEMFKRKIEELKLQDFVNLVAYSTGKKKAEQFMAADVFIHPTLNDTFALVILEAMEAGLPIISTYEGAIPEIINNGIDGLLVPKDDASALSKQMEKLIIDASLRREMGRNARKTFLDKYTFEKYEKRMAEFLSNIVAHS